MVNDSIQEVKLSDLTSTIEVRFFRGEASTQRAEEILVIEFSGVYPVGSDGNSDAHYMYAMGKAAIYAWNPKAIILDMSNLSYQWGDMLEMVFDIGARYYGRALPRAIVVGPKCHNAVHTLINGLGADDPHAPIEYVFTSLSEAWVYMSKKKIQKTAERRS